MRDIREQYSYLGFSDEEWEQLEYLAAIANVDLWQIMPIFHDSWASQLSFTVTAGYFGTPAPDALPVDEKQRARARSKKDRRRKSRGGKYTWGGPSDERRSRKG